MNCSLDSSKVYNKEKSNRCCCYVYPKTTYNPKDVKFVYVFFENGDYLSLNGSELIDISVNTYDRLVWHHKGVCPVVESGYIKFKIGTNCNYLYNGNFLYNAKEYRKNRKAYIENRFCNESVIAEVWLFDDNNWHKPLLGNIKAKMENGYLILEFLPHFQLAENAGKMHNVYMANVIKKNVHSIDLDFENCESFVVYNSEILDINLKFAEELVWVGDLYRNVVGGYIKLKLDDDFNPRANHLFDNDRLKTKDFEKRLCGKKGEAVHDICNLYVSYYHAGFGSNVTEHILVEDMRPDYVIDAIVEEDRDPFFDGGICKKLKDSTIIITFGENAFKTMEKLTGEGVDLNV